MISLILYFTLQLQASGIAMDTDTGAILSDVGGAEIMGSNPKDKPQRPTKPPE
ncbi:hypothetical protein AN214_02844 [Pseudoalteromonas sp. P1-9]|uniref:hypothetical protein n=1 Tax=Pseudoalteromonas sp. P1-9 TaxID=1710354 RepID=UPI0007072885|nr:hypothetical protein [Pseudoalteromonas sp. P1-9]KPV95053.1 hypothetical protein AN214_02844 [Pseudoalteromonas sp. P1-9]